MSNYVGYAFTWQLVSQRQGHGAESFHKQQLGIMNTFVLGIFPQESGRDRGQPANRRQGISPAVRHCGSSLLWLDLQKCGCRSPVRVSVAGQAPSGNITLTLDADDIRDLPSTSPPATPQTGKFIAHHGVRIRRERRWVAWTRPNGLNWPSPSNI